MIEMRIAVAGATGRAGTNVVDVLHERGHEVVAMSRSTGVDVTTGAGLDKALEGVEAIIDVATTPSPDGEEATRFFTASAAHLHEAGRRAGVGRLVSTSIVGLEHATNGYSQAKLGHEKAVLDGPVPSVVLRATQFHEFVEQLVDWGTQGDVAYVPAARMQLVSARAVAEKLVDLATAPELPAAGSFPEIAGPREERLAEAARLLVARRGAPARVDEVSDPADPDREMFEGGGLLPGPDATLAGPTYADWLG
jgi:uncharacterized protein YbjT (DUF2867 family)